MEKQQYPAVPFSANFRRSVVPGATYFFTVNTYQRCKVLTDLPFYSALKQALREVKAHHPFTIDAFVLLPDHLHCIWTLPQGDGNYAFTGTGKGWVNGVTKPVAVRLSFNKADNLNRVAITSPDGAEFYAGGTAVGVRFTVTVSDPAIAPSSSSPASRPRRPL